MRQMAYPAPRALLAAALLCTAACGVGSSDRRVSFTVTRADVRFTVPALGYLESTKASPIAVPQVPTGALKVKELAPEGSIVQPGDIVLVFDSTQLDIDLQNHNASFRSADRRIDRTQLQSQIETGSIDVMKEVAELERDNVDAFKIVDESIYSRLEILREEVRKDEASETILFADASILLRGQYYDIEKRILGVERGQVGGNIQRVETSLANLVLKAPIGGLILYKKNWRGGTVAVGDSLWPGNVVLSIVDPESLALTAYVLEKDAAGVRPGAQVEVLVDARPGRGFAGTVRTIAEVSSPIERNSPVKYSEVKVDLIDAPAELLKPGMKAEARIRSAEVTQAIVVPRSAIKGPADAPWVLVSSSGKAEQRRVTLGPGDHVQVAIMEGLSEGDSLIMEAAPSEAPAEQPAAPSAGRKPPAVAAGASSI